MSNRRPCVFYSTALHVAWKAEGLAASRPLHRLQTTFQGPILHVQAGTGGHNGHLSKSNYSLSLGGTVNMSCTESLLHVLGGVSQCLAPVALLAFILALQKAGRHLCCLLHQQQGMLTSERLPGWPVAVPLPACPSRSMPPELLGPLRDCALACSQEQGMCLSHQGSCLHGTRQGRRRYLLHQCSLHPASSNLQGIFRAIFRSKHEGGSMHLTWQVACASRTLKET